jgi:hypothetical protein
VYDLEVAPQPAAWGQRHFFITAGGVMEMRWAPISIAARGGAGRGGAGRGGAGRGGAKVSGTESVSMVAGAKVELAACSGALAAFRGRFQLAILCVLACGACWPDLQPALWPGVHDPAPRLCQIPVGSLPGANAQEALSHCVQHSLSAALEGTGPLRPLTHGGSVRAFAAAFEPVAYSSRVASAADLLADLAAARAWLEGLAALPSLVPAGPLLFEAGDAAVALQPAAAGLVWWVSLPRSPVCVACHGA